MAVALIGVMALSFPAPAAAAAPSAALDRAGATAAAGSQAQTPGGPVATPDSVRQTNQVIVRWTTAAAAAAATPSRAATMSKVAGHRVTFARISSSGASIYRLDSKLGSDAPLILAALRHVSGVVSVEPDLWMTADVLPNDPLASDLWGLLGSSDGSPYGVDALGAWPTTQGSGVTVAVIDTGLVSHPDLAGQSVPGYDMVSSTDVSNDGDGRDPDASDPGDWCYSTNSSWHGTHVAGTIAALANNSIGVFGGAPGVKIQPVRVLGTCGGYMSDVADGIRWAGGGTVPGVPANPTPARVLNLSLGASSPTCPDEVSSAIADARSHGAVVVVAAGNSSVDAAGFTPANCPAALTVAATDSSGLRASFSNFGAAVDMAAPGVAVYSTVDSGTTVPVGPAYASYSGTSVATPHVTLSAALVAAYQPELSPDAIELVLRNSVIPFGSDASSGSCAVVGCGAGIVNAARAVDILKAGAPIVGDVSTVPFALPGASVTVTATAVALNSGGVTSADVSLDGGPWSPMAAADGAFGGLSESLTTTIVAPPAHGTYQVCVRASDGDSNTSDGTACTSLGVDTGAPTVNGVALDPATADLGTPIAVTATATDDTAVNSAEVRVDDGAWNPMLPADGSFGGTTEALRGHVGVDALSVAGAGYHSCAFVTGGALMCWGENTLGEIGDGTTATRTTPVALPLPGVTSLSVSLWTTCAVLADTTVRCWGWNGTGLLGNGTTTNSSTPVAVEGLTGAVAVTAGEFHACAVLIGGTISCWGLNDYGQLGDLTTTMRTTPVKVAGISNAIAVAVGAYHTCALLVDKTVRCWGFNISGQLGNNTTNDSFTPVKVAGLSDVKQIGASGHTCALLDDGTVRCWGESFAGELGDGTDTERHAPVEVVGLTGVTELAVGGNHNCALLGSGTVDCWGYNAYGQIGDGTTTDRYAPVPVSEISGATSLSSGTNSNCAGRPDGTVACWGYNVGGLLGTGTSDTGLTPQPVAWFGRIAAGVHQVCVRATDTAGFTGADGSCASLTVKGPLAGATYVAVTPSRVVDSRSGARLGLSASLTSGQPQVFWVAGRSSNPAVDIPYDAVAVTGNLTAVNEGSSGYVSLSPGRPAGSPATSTINFPKADTRANALTIPLGAGGVLWATFVGASGTKADVIFDVTGYFTRATSGATYVTVTPNRLADSRSGIRTGMTASLVSGNPASFQATGISSDPALGIPSNAVAVTGNLTAVNEGSAGYLSLTPQKPAGTPATSTINFPKGDTRANALTVPLGAGGVLWVTFMGAKGSTADVIFDVTGYFVPGTAGASYVPVTPSRLADSRAPLRLGLGASLVSRAPGSFQVTGRSADPALDIPAGAIAVTGNLTVVNEGSAGYVSLTPDEPTGAPSTSTINFPKGDTRANALTVPLGSGGVLWVTFMGATGTKADVIFDVTGYFTR